MSHDPHHGGDGHHPVAELPHATKRDYTIGFILSVILTVIPFGLVMAMPLSASTTGIIIMAFAMVQVIVHMVYFLHMNGKVEDGWSMTTLIFTLIVIVIMMAGSMWVMHHLHSNMMPDHTIEGQLL